MARKKIFIKVGVHLVTGHTTLRPKRWFSDKEEAYRWVHHNIMMKQFPSHKGPAKFMMWVDSLESSDNLMVFVEKTVWE